ncbi:hypothetical protein [Streptomyces sp. NPDC060022]|uniref:hypothetical protein n=1 Tax=Streptomyces sp. NPDC060022 TaxID=3347039 RepID=UPI0036A0D9A7
MDGRPKATGQARYAADHEQEGSARRGRQPLNLAGARLRVLHNDEIRFHGQPVAVVVATTLEARQHAATRKSTTPPSRPPPTLRALIRFRFVIGIDTMR